MDGPDLLSIGKHCQEPSCSSSLEHSSRSLHKIALLEPLVHRQHLTRCQHCRQKDFLPFTCDCCRKVYCIEHRTYNAHACPEAQGKEETTIVCPLCARLVRIAGGEDPNVVFDRHTKGDCEPSNYARVNKKPRCPVPGCKEKLNVVNTHICKYCSTSVCLKHRFAEDHACAHKPRPGGAQTGGAGSVLSQLLRFGQGSSQAKPSGLGLNASAKVQELAQAAKPQRAKQGQDQSILRGQAKNLTRREGQRQIAENRQTGREEICPICSKSFSNISLLIAHSREHEAHSSQQDICPHCRAAFPNPVLLVEHVERHHTDHKGCVVC